MMNLRDKLNKRHNAKGKKQNTLTTIIYCILFLICLGILLQKSASFTVFYLDEPSVTSVSFMNEPNLQFPAMTLCEPTLKQASNTSGIAMGWNLQPNYKTFPFNNMTVSQFIWKYSFTLNDMVKNCKVGSISCWAEESESFLSNKNSGEIETKTDAGIWISRFQLQKGEHALCHTFLSNLTVNVEDGVDKILMKMSPPSGFLNLVNKKAAEITEWKIMIHDREEMGLFEGYNINVPPLFIVIPDLYSLMKIKISPMKRIALDKSTSRCNKSFSYSRQRCLLECSWQVKLDSMSKMKNISCLPLGIYVAAESAYGDLPICNHATANDSKTGSPGYYEFVKGSGDNFYAKLDGPASICTSQCLPRCQKTEYNPQEQFALSAEKSIVSGFDMKLYFGSTEVQVMEDYISYNADNLFADLSGIIGTLLGFSFLGFGVLSVKYLLRMKKKLFG